MQEVVFSAGQFLTRPLCFLRRAVVPLGLVCFPLEVVLVFPQSVARIQQGIVGECDDSRVTDAKVNTGDIPSR